MAIPENPTPFPNLPNVGQADITGACTDRTGATATNLKTVFTAGASGSLLTRIHFHATVTTAAACLLVFLKIGSTYTMIGEITVTAVTPTNTVVAFAYDWFPAQQEPLPSGATIVVGQTIAQDMHATAFGGDY